MLPEFERFVEIIGSLPGIGKKSAMRIVFYLLKQDYPNVEAVADNIKTLRQAIELCDDCGCLKAQGRSCDFCQNPNRDPGMLCIVEQPSDVFFIENTGDFRGLYHVLGGVLDPLEGVTPEDLRFESLLNRVSSSFSDETKTKLHEVIVATNPSVEGDATARYILRLLKNFDYLKVSRIASGMAMGSQLDYADSFVIAQSLRQRIALRD